jgi:putative ABC transport system permease protein
VISYNVTRRAGEMGVRVALGADRGDVLGLVMLHGARLAGLGVLLGLGGGFLLARALQALMKDAGQFHLQTFLLSTLLLAGTALAATYVPARRAAAADATVLLRLE